MTDKEVRAAIMAFLLLVLLAGVVIGRMGTVRF
jgi:hypothetical protein